MGVPGFIKACFLYSVFLICLCPPYPTFTLADSRCHILSMSGCMNGWALKSHGAPSIESVVSCLMSKLGLYMAASAVGVWMDVWMGECGMCCGVSNLNEVSIILQANTNHFHKICMCLSFLPIPYHILSRTLLTLYRSSLWGQPLTHCAPLLLPLTEGYAFLSLLDSGSASYSLGTGRQPMARRLLIIYSGAVMSSSTLLSPLVLSETRGGGRESERETLH